MFTCHIRLQCGDVNSRVSRFLLSSAASTVADIGIPVLRNQAAMGHTHVFRLSAVSIACPFDSVYVSYSLFLFLYVNYSACTR